LILTVEPTPLRSGAARAPLANDIDPIEAREAQRQAEAAKEAQATTFTEAAKACIAAHEAGWRNPRTVPQ